MKGRLIGGKEIILNTEDYVILTINRTETQTDFVIKVNDLIVSPPFPQTLLMPKGLYTFSFIRTWGRFKRWLLNDEIISAKTFTRFINSSSTITLDTDNQLELNIITDGSSYKLDGTVYTSNSFFVHYSPDNHIIEWAYEDIDIDAYERLYDGSNGDYIGFATDYFPFSHNIPLNVYVRFFSVP